MRLVLKRAILWTITCTVLGIACTAICTAEEPSGFTAEKSLSLLKEGNAKFVADQPAAPDINASRRTELTQGQHPFAVVVTCADSRVAPEYIFHQGLGDIFVIRVAGNIADPYVIGSVEYAVEHLHVPLVVVLGHEKCGAVTAAMGSSKPEGNLGKLIAEIDVGEKGTGSADATLSSAIRHNAEKQTEKMVSQSSVLKESVEEKKAKIITAIYHLDDGKVEWIEK